MNDSMIIVVVVLLVGVVSGLVFIGWRTRYQPKQRGQGSTKQDAVVIKTMSDPGSKTS